MSKTLLPEETNKEAKFVIERDGRRNEFENL